MNHVWLLYFFPVEAALTFGVLAVLSVDLLLRRRGVSSERRAWVSTGIGIMALGAGGVLRILAQRSLTTLFTNNAPIRMPGVDGLMFVADDFSIRGTFIILGLSGLSLILARGGVRLRNTAEYVALVLSASAGFTLMTAANHLLAIFLSIELASLSLYILTAFNKRNPDSAEAGLKYFFYGSVAAAFLLFGFSLLHGSTGAMTLPAIADALAKGAFSHAFLLLPIALVMIFTGFAYKTAAAPFHLWAPDVYQGAPPACAALVASASKVAGFVLVARFLAWMPNWFPDSGKLSNHPHSELFFCWFWVMVVFIAASLLLGNLVALVQKNLRRLLAYSAIAHAGVLLLAVVSSGAADAGNDPVYVASAVGILRGGDVLLFYLIGYGLATAGAFGVVAVLDNNGGCREITDLAGLRQRSPLLAACLGVFVLSLAGIPPLAGFLSKFVVFLQAAKAALQNPEFRPLLWLVILAVVISAVALYYYLQILKAAFVTPAPTERDSPGIKKIQTPIPVALALVLTAIALIVLGIAPGILLP